jgi:hypothetical protein
MSAYVVHPDHISYLVQVAIGLGRASRSTLTFGDPRTGIGIEIDTASEVGACLLQENIASVRYRYPDCTYDDLPGPIPTPAAINYQYRPLPVQLDPVQVLKAIRCYEYQSCEHPGWQESEAKRFCELLIDYAVRNLPGYDNAAWEVTREHLLTKEHAV